MRAKPRSRRWILGSELPDDAVAGAPRITLFGRRCALIEGHRGVVEMSDACIRFRSGSGVISIRGEGLEIRELSLDAAMVSGETIESVSSDEKRCRGGDLRADDA